MNGMEGFLSQGAEIESFIAPTASGPVTQREQQNEGQNYVVKQQLLIRHLSVLSPC